MTASQPELSPSFAGGFDRRSHDARDGGQSTYDGSIVVTTLDRDIVARILPATLRLADPVSDIATHPVIYLLGRQDALLYLLKGDTVPSGHSPYNELILLVPYTVHVPDGDRWHNFAARMYLDDDAAVRAGNEAYAYSKALATFGSLKAERFVQDDQELRMFESQVDVLGPWVRGPQAEGSLDGFSDIQQILEMPIVGHSVAGDICSYFEWAYDDAFVAPARSRHRFVNAFRKGMEPWPALGWLANTPNGAFAVRGIRWRLSYELPYLPPNQPPACRFAGSAAA